MENIIVNAVHLRNPYELSLGKEEKMSEIISKMIENVVFPLKPKASISFFPTRRMCL